MMKTKLLILISAGMFATAGAYAQTTAPAQNPRKALVKHRWLRRRLLQAHRHQ